MVAACGAAAAPGLPPADVALRVQGADLVNDQGETVVLRAINLGNWLLIEPWMYGQNDAFVRDQATFINILRSRFGDDEADRLLALHRAGWITQRDFDNVAAAGFNAVRIPVSHIVLEAEPYTPNEEGFALLASAFEMAEHAGLYVILDMHSAPGGQSTDQPSGDITANNLWTDPDAQERLAWLWQYTARRFKNQRNFIAYDLLNEPYGNYAQDISDELIDIMDCAIEAVRVVDPNRLILVPAPLQGIRIYGAPADRGWTNVGLTEHFYPGIFDGQPPTLGTHARFLTNTMRDRADLARSYGVPYLLGEFNPVFDRAGGPDTVRAWFDAAESQGVHAAIWALKLVKQTPGVGDNNWYLTTNSLPLNLGDIRTSSLSQISGAFSLLAVDSLAIDTAYVEAMTNPAFVSPLPAVPERPLSPPAVDTWPSWTITDVGDVTRSGGQRVVNGSSLGADELTLYATGADLFNTTDSLRLASRTTPPSFTVSGVFDAFEGGPYAQAGVTVRASTAPNAAHVSLVVTPDGRVQVKSRGATGIGTGQRFIANVGFPVGLAIGRNGSSVAAWMTNADGAWVSVPLSESASVGTSPHGGFFALANEPGPLTSVHITAPTLDDFGSLTPGPTLDTGANLLTNASFESGAGSTATGWTPTGTGLTRETGWVPLREGNALLAYRHWQTSGGASAGAVQRVSGLTPGATYELTVYANRDDPSGSLADHVELRIDTTDGRWLELVSFDVRDIATGNDWSRLQVRFVATQSEHDVRLLAYPSSAGNRDGAVKFDGLMLTELDP